jgi:EAL domain-containing protein (putative c-di-GMP-specific phosphodiesterase class I)
MEISLRAALDQDQFMLLYQPQYDNNQKIIGAEALLRWRHPEKGLISPDDFIPLAEENKMIISIGDWVLETACRQMQEWPELDYISVNISPVQIKDDEFIERTRQILRPYARDVRRLMMEMTEGIMIENAGTAMDIIRRLQAMGIGISIDDFGKGYSSLVYLKSLPLNQLKVDKGFVDDIGSDRNGEVIVETIVAMARHLQLDVIAEGVETELQFAFLRGQGCHKFQGYYFSHPLAADQFGKLLRENHKLRSSR